MRGGIRDDFPCFAAKAYIVTPHWILEPSQQDGSNGGKQGVLEWRGMDGCLIGSTGHFSFVHEYTCLSNFLFRGLVKFFFFHNIPYGTIFMPYEELFLCAI